MATPLESPATGFGVFGEKSITVSFSPMRHTLYFGEAYVTNTLTNASVNRKISQILRGMRWSKPVIPTTGTTPVSGQLFPTELT